MSFGFGTPGTGFNFGTTTPSTTTTSTTSTTGFGFGTSNTSTPSTGFNFATTPSTNQPSTSAFGTGFGTTSTTGFGTTPTSTTGFGTTPSTTAPGFNFSNTGSTLGSLSAPITRQDTTGPGIGSSGFSFGPSLAPTTPTLFSGSSAPSSSTPSWNVGTNSWAPTPVKPAPLTAQQRMQSIAEAFNPNSSECRFRHMLYNKVPEGDADKYIKPSNVNDRLWYQAVEANPDPKQLVPVQATGFQDLKLRIEEQDKATGDHSKALEEIQKFLTSLQRKRDLDTAIKIEQYKRRHVELSHRLLRVMKKIEVLRSKGYSLSLDEEAFRSKLSSLQRELNQPNLFKGRLNELSALVRMQEERQSSTMYDTVDDESLEKMHKFLSDQTAALAHIVNILKKDLRDISIIAEGLNDKGKSDVY